MANKQYVKSFVHKLNFPIQYSNLGEFVEAESITVNAPTNRIINYTTVLEQEYNKAIFEVSSKFSDKITAEDKVTLASNSEQQDTPEARRDSIMAVLSSYADLKKCYDALQKILTFGYGSRYMAMLDNTQNLTEAMYMDLSTCDTKELLVLYVENFIATSLDI